MNKYKQKTFGNSRKSPDRAYVHRLVVEESIGRKLSSDEHVHHIDGDKSNNDISNLQLMSRSEHLRMHALENGLGKDRAGVEPTNKVPESIRSTLRRLRQKEGWKYIELQAKFGLSYPTVKKYAS